MKRILILAFVLLMATLPAFSQTVGKSDIPEIDGHLIKQLSLIANFSNLQNETQNNAGDLNLLKLFIETASGQAKTESHDEISNFAQLLYSENNEIAEKTRKTLHFAGRMYFYKHKLVENKPAGFFSEHVIEAIKINKERGAYYASRSNGRTKMLSNFYTSLEYLILPVAKVMDRLAEKYQQAGIPVLVNDFVSMNDIKPADASPARTGKLDKAGKKMFKKALSEFRRCTLSSALAKDFAMVKFHAIKGLTDLRNLEKAFNCNLSMCVHLIESIGLAARNAAELKKITNGATDNYYRAFIILQNSGITGFSKVDLMAQEFHQQGIGIIVNDLPAIPFP